MANKMPEPGKYPDRTLSHMAISAGAKVRCLWEERGPKDTGVAWMECMLINDGIVIVETFKGGGWQVFLGATTLRVDDTLVEVFNHCKVKLPTEQPAG